MALNPLKYPCDCMSEFLHLFSPVADLLHRLAGLFVDVICCRLALRAREVRYNSMSEYLSLSYMNIWRQYCRN